MKHKIEISYGKALDRLTAQNLDMVKIKARRHNYVR